MKYSDKLSLKKIIKLTRSSEKKFQQGNFKEAIEDKRNVRKILNSASLDIRIVEEFNIIYRYLGKRIS